MVPKVVSKWMSELGKKGGKTTAKKLTREQRRRFSAKGGKGRKGWRKVNKDGAKKKLKK